jgi:hypothetical protein
MKKIEKRIIILFLLLAALTGWSSESYGRDGIIVLLYGDSTEMGVREAINKKPEQAPFPSIVILLPRSLVPQAIELLESEKGKGEGKENAKYIVHELKKSILLVDSSKKIDTIISICGLSVMKQRYANIYAFDYNENNGQECCAIISKIDPQKETLLLRNTLGKQKGLFVRLANPMAKSVYNTEMLPYYRYFGIMGSKLIGEGFLCTTDPRMDVSTKTSASEFCKGTKTWKIAIRDNKIKHVMEYLNYSPLYGATEQITVSLKSIAQKEPSEWVVLITRIKDLYDSENFPDGIENIEDFYSKEFPGNLPVKTSNNWVWFLLGGVGFSFLLILGFLLSLPKKSSGVAEEKGNKDILAVPTENSVRGKSDEKC